MMVRTGMKARFDPVVAGARDRPPFPSLQEGGGRGVPGGGGGDVIKVSTGLALLEGGP